MHIQTVKLASDSSVVEIKRERWRAVAAAVVRSVGAIGFPLAGNVRLCVWWVAAQHRAAQEILLDGRYCSVCRVVHAIGGRGGSRGRVPYRSSVHYRYELEAYL